MMIIITLRLLLQELLQVIRMKTQKLQLQGVNARTIGETATTIADLGRRIVTQLKS